MNVEVKIDQELLKDCACVPEDARLIITARDSINDVMNRIRNLCDDNPTARNFFYNLAERMTVELYE